MKTIPYMGSKRKLLGFLQSSMDDYLDGTELCRRMQVAVLSIVLAGDLGGGLWFLAIVLEGDLDLNSCFFYYQQTNQVGNNNSNSLLSGCCGTWSRK